MAVFHATGVRASVVALTAFLMLASALAVATSDAATVSAAWRARIGASGVNGTATISAYTSGTGAIVLKLSRLRAYTYHPVTLSKGTCSALGTTLIRFPAIKTTSTGTAARTTALTAYQASLIRNATKGTGRIAIRIGSAATGGVRCGLFAVLPVASPTPTPSPSGATLYVGPYFAIAMPSGWVPATGVSGYARVAFVGPAGQALLADAVASPLSIDETIARTVATAGVTIELNEPTTMDGEAARIVAYHFTNLGGETRYEIDALCVHGNGGYWVSYSNRAGSEAADLAFFRSELATFAFFGVGF